MAFLPVSFDETGIDDTAKTVVTCASGKRVVINAGDFKLLSLDDTGHGFTVRKTKAAAEVWAVHVTGQLDPGAQWLLPFRVVLDDDDEEITVQLDEVLGGGTVTADASAITN